MDIVGLACHVGPFTTARELEHAVYHGEPGNPARGGDIDERELMGRVAEEALRDAGFGSDFTGPTFVISADSTGVAALQLAALTLPDVDAVLVGAVGGEGAAAVVLSRAEPDSRGYASIDALPVTEPAPDLSHVDYVELISHGDKPFEDLARRWPDGRPRIALGNMAASDTLPVATLLSVIKVALCLHHGCLPAWSGPAPEDVPPVFFLPQGSQPWLRKSTRQPRTALIAGTTAWLVLRGRSVLGATVAIAEPSMHGQLLVPLGTNGLLQPIDGADRVVLGGRDIATLQTERAHAARHLPASQQSQREWSTPAGSYHTPSPIGPDGKLALVFPGMLSTYPGLGADLFRTFPGLLTMFESEVDNPIELFPPELLHPRHGAELAALPADFASMAQISSTFAWLTTQALRRLLGVPVQGAVGYSLGETSMLYALGSCPPRAYGQPERQRIAAGFHEQFGAIRAAWDVADDIPDDEFWTAMVLFASMPAVRAALPDYDRVFLTHVNSPAEVVIAGDPTQCADLVRSLGCDSAPSGATHALHCPMVDASLLSESSLPETKPVDDVTMFTAFDYAPITEFHTEALVANNAAMLGQPVDFPRLINTMYDHGYRYFVEVGPGGAASRWIRDILAGKPHLAESVDRRGESTASGFGRVLARLYANGLPVNLDPFLPDPALVAAIPVSRPPLMAGEEPPISFPERFPAGVLFDEHDIAEFVSGKLENVFGTRYAPIDGFARRIRLPAQPYCFVSRVTALDAELGRFDSPSFIRTEYDVPLDAWYLVDGQVPLGIAAEAGQGNLMLASYLGVDFDNRGERVYRVLGGSVVPRGPAIRAGQRVRCDIWIDRFLRGSGPTLVFFRYVCHADGRLAFEMRDGCAGFFTDDELATGSGITPGRLADHRPAESTFKPLARTGRTGLDGTDLDLLTEGRYAQVFGTGHDQEPAANQALRLAGGRLRMIDEIESISVSGGAAGQGECVASARVRPDAWFYDCHFPGDPVMPGTLVIEGAVQALQIYALYAGLHLCLPDATYQPISGLRTTTTLRGQLTPATGDLRYELTITEIGLLPRPHVIADVLARADGIPVAHIANLGIEIREKPGLGPATFLGRRGADGSPAILNELHMAHLAKGDHAMLGAEFEIFRDGRRTIRGPNGGLAFMDRLMRINGGSVEPGLSAEIEYDVPADAWYFRDNGYPFMPTFCQMEAALQPTVFPPYFLGSTLRHPDAEFLLRNLDGRATALADVDPRGRTIRQRIELLSYDEIDGLHVLRASFELAIDGTTFYSGEGVSGFITDEHLARSAGLDRGDATPLWLDTSAIDEIDLPALRASSGRLRLGTGRLALLDGLGYVPDGGRHGAGYLRGHRLVSPEAWYWPLHFHQDPVMPGSLSVEIVQSALRAYVMSAGLTDGVRELAFDHARGLEMRWRYRGQFLPEDPRIDFEVHLKPLRWEPGRLVVTGDASLWKGPLRIYELTDVAIAVRFEEERP